MMISLAYAAPAAGAGGGSSTLIGTVIPLLIFAGLFYVILLRPELKRRKEHEKILEGLKKGDKIITSSGIMGSIVSIKDDVATVMIGENVKIRIKKQYITEVDTTSE